MKLNTEINKETLEYFYREYKPWLVPILAIIISFFLFLFFLIPQITSFPAKKSEVDQENIKLKKLNEVRSIIENTNTQVLDTNLKLASNTLPVDKNFELSIRAMSQAADKSDVTLLGYGLKSAVEANLAASERFPKLEFELSIDANPESTLAFINELNRTLPIVEVTSLNFSNGVSNMVLVFYYKQINPGGVSDRTQIRVLNPAEENALSEISSWFGSEDAPVEIEEEEEEPDTDSSPF